MFKITMKNNRLILNLLIATALSLVLGCGQSPSEPEPVAEAPAPAEPHVQEHGVKSIDADGNVAPFGMAARQPVEISEPNAASESDGQEIAAAAASSALFGTHCGACHGPDAKGVEGLGLNLVESQLVASSSAPELAAFLKAGRAGDAPDSVTGVPMPSFVWMNDADLAEITGYLKSL